MRCNPWRWLWGLIPLGLVFAIAVLSEQQVVERDLERQAQDALAKAGLEWARVVFSGRDATLSGRAAQESEQRSAIGIVNGIWGVRTVEDRTDLVALAKSYTWSAALRSNRIRLAGHVPNEMMRRTIVGAVKVMFPGRDLDDRMQLARGAPDHNQWLGGVSFGLKQLSRLKVRGRVELEGTVLAIEGEAEDAAAYESVRAALANSLPQGIRVRADKVMPPTVKPYLWTAVHSGRQLELAGYVPSERQRDEIFELAKRSFPSAVVVDRMSIAAGEPKGWQGVVGTVLSRLAEIEEGSVELRDAQVGITGLADTQKTSEAIRTALKSEIPAAFKINEQIKFKAPVPGPDVEAKRQASLEAERAAAAAEAQRLADLERQRAAEAARKAAEDEARRKADLARCRVAVSEAVGPESVTFARASADLSRRSQSALDKLVEVVGGCPAVQLEIGGHADAEGTPERKQKLSEQRAQAVMQYLSSAGVAASRMTTAGYADSQPVAANDRAEDRAKNRRISIGVKAN